MIAFWKTLSTICLFRHAAQQICQLALGWYLYCFQTQLCYCYRVFSGRVFDYCDTNAESNTKPHNAAYGWTDPFPLVLSNLFADKKPVQVTKQGTNRKQCLFGHRKRHEKGVQGSVWEGVLLCKRVPKTSTRLGGNHRQPARWPVNNIGGRFEGMSLWLGVSCSRICSTNNRFLLM